MPSLADLKEREITDLPLLLFECILTTGHVERWSTHAVTLNSVAYAARVLRHEGFSFHQGLEEAAGGSGQLSLVLADADGQLAQLERTQGFRGARLKARFAFFNCTERAVQHDPTFLFEGYADAPESVDGREVRLHFSNRIHQQRLVLPALRVQNRCPWAFPKSEEERQEARDGGSEGRYSRFYGCGYSAGVPGGRGNLNGGDPFVGCDYTKASCMERGMFRVDAANNPTARFAGFQYLPATIQVRGHGDKESRLSAALENKALGGDSIPLVYGTAWVDAPAIFARSDGNLLRAEVLLGQGPLEGVLRVVVDGYDLPRGEEGKNMTATGWYNLISPGGREGGFNPDFSAQNGEAEGDPHGSIAALAVVVPSETLKSEHLPKVQSLVQGLRLRRFDIDGTELPEALTDNPAWVILDLLRRAGWGLSEIDVPSFSRTAAHCGELIEITDPDGRPRVVPRFAVNLTLKRRQSLGQILRGVRNCAALYLWTQADGKLALSAERSLAHQHPVLPPTSNATSQLNGGWPAYEFCDGTYGFGGILAKSDGSTTLRFGSRRNAETPNRLSVEFQDAFSDYRQNSVSLADVEDAGRVRHEVSGSLAALGLPHAEQATRVARHHLLKSVQGNEYADIQTSIRGLGINPGDIITITDLKTGHDRAPFRVNSVSPATNFETVRIQAQRHQDEWYAVLEEGIGAATGRNRPGAEPGLPRPLAGTTVSAEGEDEYTVQETLVRFGEQSMLQVEVRFHPPRRETATAIAVPVLPHSVEVTSGAGSLAGNQMLYYCVTALDGSGNETALSAPVRVALPASATGYRVRLQGLLFSDETAGYRVYRGGDPVRLRRVIEGTGTPLFVDDPGMPWTALPPPDPNYDSARFYYRFEIQPEVQATEFGLNTIGSSGLALAEHSVQSRTVRITRGKGRGQEAIILDNTSATLTVSEPWRIQPDVTSHFVIAESSWQSGGTTRSDQATMVVPNRPGMILQILGRAANGLGRECGIGVSPLQRWRLGEGGGGTEDTDTPPQPVFALTEDAGGTVVLGGIGFPTFLNVRGVQSGTLMLHHWNEHQSPTAHHLSAELAAAGDTLNLSTPISAGAGNLIQVEEEVLRVIEVLGGGLEVRVERGFAETTPAVHAALTPAYPLSRRVDTVSFPRDFFGSPASGGYAHSIPLPGSRLAVAEFFVTNAFGNSPTAIASFTGLVDAGLRILPGGQISVQTEGELAVQGSVAPPFILDGDYVVRDVWATVREAPSGGGVACRVLVDDEEYAALTIAAQSLESNVVGGFGKIPLQAKKKLTVEVLSVPTGTGTSSGRDLTVTIRL